MTLARFPNTLSRDCSAQNDIVVFQLHLCCSVTILLRLGVANPLCFCLFLQQPSWHCLFVFSKRSSGSTAICFLAYQSQRPAVHVTSLLHACHRPIGKRCTHPHPTPNIVKCMVPMLPSPGSWVSSLISKLKTMLSIPVSNQYAIP